MSRYIVGKTEVNAWKITNSRYDSDTTAFYVTLDDGREVVRPATHGYRPKVGDYVVQGLPVLTVLRDGVTPYVSEAVPSIVTAKDFVNTYTRYSFADAALLQTVAAEMAKPVTTKSAKIAEQALDPTRIVEQPTVILPGTVDAIIPPTTTEPEKAQITVADADPSAQTLRIENVLTDENGDDAQLAKGDHVEVAVTETIEEDIPENDMAPLNPSALEAIVHDACRAAQPITHRRDP